ncbi:hypothetical protein, partial [Paracoccus alcaliphilus]|uniref:hypothetical protein n=1 Tax=Paracoccus alcaliphilus TaxID=34002 RepID=UPI001B8D98D5
TSDMTALLCGSSQTHPGTQMPSGGGYTINAHRLVDRYHAGKRVLVSDFPVEWMYSEGEHE